MQVIPKADGRATAPSAEPSVLSQPSIVHLDIAPEKVLRFERRGDDLVLVRQDGQQTVVHGFFQDYADGGRNDLVLQDETGVRWWGQYASPWTGFQFTEIEWLDGAPAALASETVPAWLIAGLAVLGVGAAASSGGGGSPGVAFIVPPAPPPAPPANQAPTGEASALSAQAGEPAQGQVTGRDADGDRLSYTLGTPPAHGAVTLDAVTGLYVYTPAPGYEGADSFQVLISDGRGGSVTVTVPVTVTVAALPANEPPSASAEPLAAVEDTPARGQVVGRDADGDTLSYRMAKAPSHGTLSLDPQTGGYSYTPDPDYHGDDSFDVTVSDGRGGSVTVTVPVTIAAVNDAPTATATALTTAEDQSATGQIIGNDVDGDTLHYSLSTGPAHGALSIDAQTGAYTYMPAPDFHGQDSFVVTVDDGSGGATTIRVPVTVTPANDAPTATAAPLTTAEDTPATGVVVAEDADGDALSYALTAPPARGTVTLDPATGAYTYTPAANAHGSDRFTVAVDDGHGAVTTVTVDVTVTPANDAPTASNLSLTTAEGAAVSGAIAAADMDGDTLSYVLTTSAAHGTVVLNPPTGTFVYTPQAHYSGSDSFVVTVSDGQGGAAASTVSIGITPVADGAVIGGQDTGEVTEDLNVTGGQLVDGGTLTVVDPDAGEAQFVAGSGTPIGSTLGSLSIDSAGHWSYSVANSAVQFLGVGQTLVEAFQVSSADGTQHTVSVTIRGVNDAPTQPPTQPNNIQAAEDFRPSVTGVIAAVTDADGDALSYSLGQGPAHGGVVVNTDGSYSYTPDLDFHGSDSFEVIVDDGKGGTLTVLVDVVVDPFTDIANDTAEAAQGVPVAIDVLANDSFENPGRSISAVDGQAIAEGGAAILLGNGQGSVALLNGQLVFTPAAGFNGGASFSYTVSSGGATETTTVAVDVNAPPVLYANAGNPAGILTKAQSDTPHSIGTALSLDGRFVLGNNPDVENSSTVPFVSVHATGSGGMDYYAFTVTQAGTVGVFDIDYARTGEYAEFGFDSHIALRNANHVMLSSNDDSLLGQGAGGSTLGMDSYLAYTFTAPGTYYLVVQRFSNLPVPAGLDYQLQVSLQNALMYQQGGALTERADGSADENTDSFALAGQFRFSDADLDDTHTASVSLLSVTDSVHGSAGALGSLTVGIGNSATADGEGLVNWAFEAPAAALDPLAQGQTRVQVYRVTVTDDQGASSFQDVTITLRGTADAPVANDDSATTDQNTSVTVAVRSNDTDPEGDSLTVTGVTQGAHGSVVIDGVTGNPIYTPSAGYAGTDQFTYTISDGNGGGDTGTVNVVVPANHVPAAVADSLVVVEGGSNTVLVGGATSVLSNDTDADGDPLTAILVSGPANGTLVLNFNGTFSYAHNGSETTSDSFSYKGSDGTVDGNTVTVSITVTPVNDPPVAVDDMATINEGASVNLAVRANDTDAEGHGLTVTSASQGAHGSVVIDAVTGNPIYTPNAGFAGTDQFTYTITDGNGGYGTATVNMTVSATAPAFARMAMQAMDFRPLGMAPSDAMALPDPSEHPTAQQAPTPVLPAWPPSEPGHGTLPVLPDVPLEFTASAAGVDLRAFLTAVPDYELMVSTQGADAVLTVSSGATPLARITVPEGANLGTQVDDWVDSGHLLLPTLMHMPPTWGDVLGGEAPPEALPLLAEGWDSGLTPARHAGSPTGSLAAAHGLDTLALGEPGTSMHLPAPLSDCDWASEHALASHH